MTTMEQSHTLARTQSVIAECLPLLKALVKGRCAVTIGGSHGKGISDERSDIDFRVFCDEIVGAPRHWETEEWKSFSRIVDRWRAQGVDIDYCWVRTIGEIDAQLEAWLSGQPLPTAMVWTLWGYHLLTDLANQVVIDDPAGVIAAWQARLTPYPRALQRAIIRKHMGSLSYWRSDYHYRNKVERGDVVFLAGIAARLVHDMMQVLFAINETYYAGDGNNLHYVATFAVQPKEFAGRISAILYPPQAENVLTTQYEAIIKLIDDIAPLAAQADTDGNMAIKADAGDA
jgi:hypothetical protein